jgi:hypothetical protein
MALQPFVGPWPLLQFLDPIQSVGPLGRGINPVQGCYLHTGDHKRRINKYTQTSMPRVGLELTASVFYRAKTVQSLHRAAIVICNYRFGWHNVYNCHVLISRHRLWEKRPVSWRCIDVWEFQGFFTQYLAINGFTPLLGVVQTRDWASANGMLCYSTDEVSTCTTEQHVHVLSPVCNSLGRREAC